LEALKELARLLKRGGSVTVIEGDHGSPYFYPQSNAAGAAIAAGITEPGIFDKGIDDLYRPAGPGGVFCRAFFKTTALKP
jgi:hypothetical protein